MNYATRPTIGSRRASWFITSSHNARRSAAHRCVRRVVVAVDELARVVVQVVQLAHRRLEIAVQLVAGGRERAHGQPCDDAEVVLGQHPLARSVEQRAALHPVGHRESGAIEHRGREVDRADRIVDDLPARDAGTAQHERHAQERVVAERSFEDHLVLAEELAVVGGDDHERVVGEPTRRERVEHTTDRVVELGNHSVVARGHHCEVFARQRRATGVRPLERPAARPGREQLVDRRLRVELVGVHHRQHFEHVVGGVAIAPRRGRVHRVMRVGEADPAEERTVDRAQPVARAVGDPRREVIFLGQRVAPRLTVVPHRASSPPAASARSARSRAPVRRGRGSARSASRTAAVRSSSSSGPSGRRCAGCDRTARARRARSRSTGRANPLRRAPIPRPTRPCRWAGTGTSWRSAPCRTGRCGTRPARAASRPSDRSRRPADRCRCTSRRASTGTCR